MRRDEITPAIIYGMKQSIEPAKTEYRRIYDTSCSIPRGQRPSFIKAQIPATAERLHRTGCGIMLGKGGLLLNDRAIDNQLRDYRAVAALLQAVQVGYSGLSDADLSLVTPEELTDDVRDFLVCLKLLQWLIAEADGRKGNEPPARATTSSLSADQRDDYQRILSKFEEHKYLEHQGDSWKWMGKTKVGEAYFVATMSLYLFPCALNVRWGYFKGDFPLKKSNRGAVVRWIGVQGIPEKQCIDRIFSAFENPTVLWNKYKENHKK